MGNDLCPHCLWNDGTNPSCDACREFTRRAVADSLKEGQRQPTKFLDFLSQGPAGQARINDYQFRIRERPATFGNVDVQSLRVASIASKYGAVPWESDDGT